MPAILVDSTDHPPGHLHFLLDRHAAIEEALSQSDSASGEHLFYFADGTDEQRTEWLEDVLDLSAALAALKAVEEEGTVPWEEIKRELGL